MNNELKTDVVVIGRGHNGLVTACYLARAGHRGTYLLALSEARFITGVMLPIDGGFSVHTPSYVDEMALFQGG